MSRKRNRMLRLCLLAATVVVFCGVVWAETLDRELTAKAGEGLFARFLFWVWALVMLAGGLLSRYWRKERWGVPWRVALVVAAWVVALDAVISFLRVSADSAKGPAAWLSLPVLAACIVIPLALLVGAGSPRVAGAEPTTNRPR